MRTGILHPIGVRKRLCVSVLGGKQSIYFSRIKKYFGFWGVFVKQIGILNIGFGFVVLNSIWEHTLNVFLTLFLRRRRVPSSSSSSVRPSVPSSSSVLCPSVPSSVPSSSSSVVVVRRPSSSSVVVVVRRRRPSSSVVVVRRRPSKYYLQDSLKHLS